MKASDLRPLLHLQISNFQTNLDKTMEIKDCVLPNIFGFYENRKKSLLAIMF